MNISGDQPDEVFAEYSLWDYSKYCDMDFLCPFQYWKKEYTREEEAPDAEGESTEDAKPTEDKVIQRDDLYRSPDLLEAENNDEESTETYSKGYDWTQQNWLKASSHSSIGPAQGPSRTVPAGNKVKTKLDKALAQPPVMNKAESIMLKMGWKGGALGKSGDGIIEPIAANAAYAAKTVGFGRADPPKKQKQVKQKPKRSSVTTYNKEYFTTNVLLYILKFVKNEIELELCFDKSLRPHERKRIHNIVGGMINGEEIIAKVTSAQMNIIEKIQSHNCFMLRTESHGERPNRQLVLYKEAPAHVYLITPDDLKDESDSEMEEDEIEIDKETTECKAEEQPIIMEVEEETNPFLKSITRHLKNEQPEVITTKLEEIKIDTSKIDLTPLGKIIEYFSEFAEQDYAEFRFLGPFESEELDAVNSFVTKVWMCLNKEKDLKDKVEDALSKFFIHENNFDLNQDCNGSVVIYKLKCGYNMKS